MVSARLPPNPARGRIAYPSAANYTPGDAENSPVYHAESSQPLRQVTSSGSERERNVQGLKAWWKGFQGSRAETTTTTTSAAPVDHRRVFGVPLSESLEYASVQISTAGPDGALYVWGVIPVVVAKCGLYLKENATEVEGAFRISGSTKRMKELQDIFDIGPKYGKNIDWKAVNYTPHDVATIFRRYLTQMPESVIPFDYYHDFRNVLSTEQSVDEAIAEYKTLIRSIPPVHQYLLLYVLDLLSVFAKKSDINLMTAPNLALIFQPGVLSHPLHDMRPREHVLSQRVLEFLIEHQDHFLMGMELKSKKAKRKPKAPAGSPSISSPITSPPLTSPVPSTSAPLPAPPPMVRADSDMMIPSDSDDEAPAGGYYIMEVAGLARTSSPISPPTNSMEAGLFPPKPTKPAVRNSPKQVEIEVMAPSDSDEDAPPGGYEVRQSDPKARAEYLSRARSKSNALAPALSRTSEGSSLSRRKTLPTKRVAERVPRLRRGNKEAP